MSNKTIEIKELVEMIKEIHDNAYIRLEGADYYDFVDYSDAMSACYILARVIKEKLGEDLDLII